MECKISVHLKVNEWRPCVSLLIHVLGEFLIAKEYTVLHLVLLYEGQMLFDLCAMHFVLTSLCLTAGVNRRPSSTSRS